MFWDRFYSLCASKGQTPAQVIAALGIAHGAQTKWRRGATPQGATLKKIAEYFGVEVSALIEPELDAATKRLLELFAQVPQDKKEALIQLIESTLKMQGLI